MENNEPSFFIKEARQYGEFQRWFEQDSDTSALWWKTAKFSLATPVTSPEFLIFRIRMCFLKKNYIIILIF